MPSRARSLLIAISVVLSSERGLADAPRAASRATGIVGAPPYVAPATAIPVLSLAFVGEAASAERLGARVGSWFQGTPTVVWTTRLASLESSAVLGSAVHEGVSAWVLLPDSKVARVLFAVAGRGGMEPRYLNCDVELDSGLDELGIERLAQVVYLSALGLWAGNMETSREAVAQVLRNEPRGKPALPPSHPPPVTPPPAPSQPPIEARVTTMVRAGFDYSARLAGDVGVAEALGAWVGVYRRRRKLDFGARLDAEASPPANVTAQGVELNTQGATFRLGASAARQFAKRASLTSDLGLAASFVRYETGAVSRAALRPDPGSVDVRPLVFARCGVRIDVDPVGVDAGLVVDTSLVRAHYDIVENGTRTEILVPWIVQPGLLLGLSW